MDLEEATELALEIQQTRPSWTVVAISMFVPITDIRPGLPFGLSVIVPGRDKPRVIWGREDFSLPEQTAPQPRPQEVVSTNTPGFLF